MLYVCSSKKASKFDYLSMYLPNYFLKAFAAQSSWTVGWIWTMEIYGRNDNYRVIVGLSTMLFWALGFITAPGIVLLLPNWRACFFAMTTPTLLFVFYAWTIPESPLWLLHMGYEKEADAILIEIAEKNGSSEKLVKPDTILVDNENAVDTIPKYAQTQLDEADTGDDDGGCQVCFSLVAKPLIRKRTMILSFLFFVASFVYYGLSLNQSSVGGDQNQFLTFTLYGLMEIPALLFATGFLSYFGRRLPTMLLYLCAGKVVESWMT